jgi:alpha-N-arabinofuranosidase
MRRILVSAGRFLCVGVSLVLAAGAQGPARDTALEATITIDASKPASYKIPRTIFGTFLEPIGNSIYGGLWAELLQNPSFEDNLWNASAIQKMLSDEPPLVRASDLGLPLPWEPLDAKQGNRYEPRWNDAANSYRSLFLMGLPDKQVGVRQKVFLPVHRMLKYVGRLYAKYQSGPREIEVSIQRRDHPEELFARSKIPLTGNEWKRYEFRLDVEAGKIAPLEPADFVIAVGNESRVLVDQASLMPADNVDGMDPEIIAMAKAMKTPLLRFGGNFTSAYHWRDGTGPRDKRVSMLNIAWGMPEYNTFGTDEFLRFCELIGARPQIALNLGSGTPGEAAGWVKYVNEHCCEHAGGLLWELGNELWGTFQVGYPTRQRVAERTKAFSDAVREVDPNAKWIATGGDEDSYRDWNETQLTNAGAFDYLSTHFVVTDDRVQRQNSTADFIAQADFALPVGLERKLREMHKQTQENPQARDRVKTAFTEWLFWARQGDAPRYDNMGGAISTAGFLNMLMRVADIVPIADMTGIMEFGGIWKRRGGVFGAPSYWAFRMYSNANAVQVVEARTEVEKYDVEQGSIRLPSIPDVPYLDVVAARNEAGDKLTLFCVNRHLTRDITARISVAGFAPGPEGFEQTLFAASIYDKNDEAHPEAVIPRERSLQWEGAEPECTFRHESVTVIELDRKN